MSSGDAAPQSCAVLIPVKPFSLAKSRLASVLSPAERSALARAMATTVVAAAHPFPVYVVCDDAEVEAWAGTVGAHVIADPGGGLDGAVASGVGALEVAGFRRVIVAHADLPLIEDFDAFVCDEPDLLLLAPDRHGAGTNVVSLPISPTAHDNSEPSPPRDAFHFLFGPGSFARHEHEARRVGLRVRVVHRPETATDIDTPADLHHLTQLRERPA